MGTPGTQREGPGPKEPGQMALKAKRSAPTLKLKGEGFPSLCTSTSLPASGGSLGLCGAGAYVPLFHPGVSTHQKATHLPGILHLQAQHSPWIHLCQEEQWQQQDGAAHSRGPGCQGNQHPPGSLG